MIAPFPRDEDLYGEVQVFLLDARCRQLHSVLAATVTLGGCDGQVGFNFLRRLY